MMKSYAAHGECIWSGVTILILLMVSGCVPPQPTIMPSTPSPDAVSFQNQRTELVFLEEIPIALENCSGSTPITTTIDRSRSTTTTIEVGITGGAEWALEVIEAKLEASFSVANATTETASIVMDVGVEAGSQVEYMLTWNETWQVGEVVLEGLAEPIPYRFRTGVQGSVSSGAPLSCPTLNPTPEPLTMPDGWSCVGLGISNDECEQLFVLYDAFGAESTLLDEGGWGSAASEWRGVSAAGGHVTGLDLGEKQLINTVPDINLPNLETLFLHDNQLSGEIPELDLPHLQFLSLP